MSGFGANVYSQVVTVAVQFAGVPILLAHWSAELYGAWLILFAVPAYLSMTELGFSHSAANDMTARLARGDRAGTVGVFQSLGALVILSAAGTLLLVTGALAFLPLGDWITFSGMTVLEARWVLWLLAAEVLVRLAAGVCHAGFRAAGDYPLQVGIYSSTLLAQHASIWVLAGLGYGPVTAAGGFLAVRVIATPVTALLLARRHPWLRFGIEQARAAQLRRLLQPALANTALPLAQALNVQGMVLVVGATLGPIAVVAFSTVRTLTRLVLQLVASVNHATEPELATAIGNGNDLVAGRLYRHAMRASFWLAASAAAVLGATGTWILHVWTQDKVTMQPDLFAWLLGSAVATAFWYGSLTLLKAGNLHLRATMIHAAAAGVAVLLTGALLATTGRLANAGLSLLVMDGIMAVYTLRAAAVLTNSSVRHDLRAALNPLPLLRLLPLNRHAA